MKSLVITLTLVGLARAAAGPPEVLDDRYELSLYAEHPVVRTPVGCTLSESGRLLVVESHTHFRPGGYEGPEKDRILSLRDANENGVIDPEEAVVWHEGEKHLMSILADPARDGTLFAATRREIFVLADLDADGKAEERTSLVKLETTGDYPHNGLCGLVMDTKKTHLYFGLGENLGHAYKLVSQQRAANTLEGGGEGGNIYSLDLRSGEITRLATGFWNPFGICLDQKGQMFAVDNDPDGSPPNRLLHIVPGGDYGYQFRYGRSGKHPLQAWNGELPGTLPMIAGTGEAACDILPVGKELWVSSWGHHRIERYTLAVGEHGFEAKMKTLVQGDGNFRPVAFAHAGDGSIFFTDWVDKSYNLHSKGRVWKLTPKDDAQPRPVQAPILSGAAGDPQARPAGSPFRTADAIWRTIQMDDPTSQDWDKLNEDQRLALTSALRWRKWDGWQATLGKALEDSSPGVRIAAVRFIADEKLESHSQPLKDMLRASIKSPQLFDALVAALQILGEDRKRYDRERWLFEIVGDESSSAEARARALAAMSPDDGRCDAKTLENLLAKDQPEALRQAALWQLVKRREKDAEASIAKLLADPGTLGAGLRADLQAAVGDRGKAPELHERKTLEAWVKEIARQPGDVRAGRRVFLSDRLGMCARCHSHSGLGTAIGPDLAGIGADGDLERLLQSILHPTREIARGYGAEMVETRDGKLHVGIPRIVSGSGESGTETFIGVDGTPFNIELSDISARSPWVASLMPEGLDARLDSQQMRDLIAFLQSGNAR